MNNADLVSQGKPRLGGGAYTAPAGTTLPKDARTALDTAFSCLGYCSEDGVTNSQSVETSSTKAWGGDIVLNTSAGGSDTFKVKLIEMGNTHVLKTVFGDGNVVGTLETGIEIKKGSTMPDARPFVFDMILKGGILKRIVIPKGVITAIGDVVYNDTTPTGYEITLSSEPDDNGFYHYEYIQTPAAQTPAAPEGE